MQKQEKLTDLEILLRRILLVQEFRLVVIKKMVEDDIRDWNDFFFLVGRIVSQVCVLNVDSISNGDNIDEQERYVPSLLFVTSTLQTIE